MRSFVRHTWIGATLVAGLTLAACGGEEPIEEELPIVVEESGPIALGEPDTTLTEPEVDVVEDPEPRVVTRTVVVRERPREAAPREEPRAEEPREEPREDVTPPRVSAIPAGTHIPVEILARIDSENNGVGDAWTGRVTRDVVVNGQVVVPAGAAISGVVTAIDEGDASDGAGSITLEARSIETVAGTRSIASAPVSGGESYRDRGFPGTETAIGAGAGAAIGAIIGGKKGAAIGAAAGGAGGAAMGSQRRDYEVAMAPGSRLTVRLEQSTEL
ncbi:MAG: hypothetical protein R3326_04240 [Gemmatimonadota bacterium]|nr:hypothetical protein [Gemmatimonadota bacterium]